MFQIRRIFDAATGSNRERLAQVQAILRAQFPDLRETQITALPHQLTNPLKYRFRSLLLVAEDAKHGVRGFAMLLHAPDLNFCYLEYLSAGRGETGHGVGGALYERVRDEAKALDAVGVFFECLPDDPALSPDPKIRAQNAARLRFYERFGARPIADTEYETPLKPGEHDPPYLVFDDLGRAEPLGLDRVRPIVRAILERKYADRCSPEYVDRVVGSFRDDPVRLRPPRYVKAPSPAADTRRPSPQRIALAVTDRHELHHVRERGYVEAPVRISSILEELRSTQLFDTIAPETFPARHVEAVHDRSYLRFLSRASATVTGGKSVYPYVFPIRNRARPPHDVPLRAGYYCIDTFTPLNDNAYRAAVRAVDCALTAARAVLDGRRLAYALVRPPGHHAERASFGGFCYLNSAAIAANYLADDGRVAILDIDYHHGNGTQDIFYERSDVLTVSIHGHPSVTYPYFSGFEDERGAGRGSGYNLNIPLREDLDEAEYVKALERALGRIAKFAPAFLVVSLGLDVARGDPTGSWLLGAKDFHRNGSLIAALGLPTLVVQEGGYRTRTLGVNARNFFQGLSEAAK
jgi:acetoin utilization deacetylase AcuC-like enzyme/GNAT superfamily N-acetyltransferase